MDKLTKEDIKFLHELSHEMNTQNKVSQADPRYWGIMNYKRIYGEKLINRDGTLIIIDGNEYELEEIWEDYLGFKDDEIISDGQYEYNKKEFISFNIEDIFERDDIEDLLRHNEIEFDIVEYEIKSEIEPNTMFLTLREAKEHLKENHYHYSSKAHPYAMTAWRSPQVAKLYDILHKIDDKDYNDMRK